MTKTLNLIISLFILIFLAIRCQGPEKQKKTQILEAKDNIKKNPIELRFENIPTEKKTYKPGEFPVLKITQEKKEAFDSIQLYFTKTKINTIFELPAEQKIDNKIDRPGEVILEAVIFKDGTRSIQKTTISYVSDIVPTIYGYEILKIYPHDRKAYTQGLVFEDGYLYESNGINAESSMRKLQIGTGEPIQSLILAPEIFAEGLTIMGDKIIQLSWQNYQGFVYDKKSFQLLAKFSYPTEGWGLTHDGKRLIMSDGTNRLFFLDPQSYSEIDRIEVYDNKGPVNELNELEYIDGEIFANIYRTDQIARIDPKTGKVLAYIDLKKLLPDRDYESDTDVLNGIAYDAKGKRLFVTGKRWPKLFEIKPIIKK